MKIKMTSAAQKGSAKLKKKEAEILELLLEDLRNTYGKPFNRGWKSLVGVPQMGKEYYHCHLTFRVVVVWQVDNQNNLCKIVYIGTREGAPY